MRRMLRKKMILIMELLNLKNKNMQLKLINTYKNMKKD